jgi:CheY-like chemotaxis protein
VLVVDDEESVRVLVDRVLKQRYDTIVAADGPEALAAAESQRPIDAVVTDLMMPGMSGAELATRLRRTDPSIKILYLTGYSDSLFEARKTLWDDEAFLDKPFSAQGLLEAVALLLDGHIPAPRARRVAPAGAHVRAAGQPAELVSLSVTGALVHVTSELDRGAACPIDLTVGDKTVQLTGRVVRCQQVQPTPSPAGPLYAAALSFVQPSARALHMLKGICDAEPPAP